MKISERVSIVKIFGTLLIIMAVSGCSGDKGSDYFFLSSNGAGSEAVLEAKIIVPAGDVSINEGESLDFQAEVTGGVAPYTYRWTFDEGAPEVNVRDADEVLFSTAGTYQVIFSVEDDDNLLDMDSITLTVNTAGPSAWYRDADGDGYGDAGDFVEDIAAPAGYVADNTDCDDNEAGIHPGAIEIPNNGIDENCDGSDRIVITTWYGDADGDGYGDANDFVEDIAAPVGYVADNTDCDDNEAGIHPGAIEIPNNGIDENCDGSDRIVITTWYGDADEDGYGDAVDFVEDIAAPAGYVADNTDCNDNDAGIHPGAEEICSDGIDQDCDGVDPTCPPPPTWYKDNDSDGYSDGTTQVSVSQPLGYYPENTLVSDLTDCNDDDSSVYPGAAEICGDGIDQDCDGSDLVCVDDDGDGFDEGQGDCDDANADVYPGAVELCGDNIDNDCNGLIDEGCTGYSIHGVLHHRGVPMYQLTDAIPVISCRDDSTGRVFADAASIYHSEDGTYEIFNLTGTIDVSVSFRVTGEEATLPGNYLVWEDVDENDAGEHDIEVERIIHLLEPWDNASIEFSRDDLPAVYETPIRFEWAALPGATHYQVYIAKVRDPDHTDGYGHMETVVDVSVQDTVYIDNLIASGTDDHYEFTVWAYDEESSIGLYVSTYLDGYAWEYWFKISATGLDADGDGYTDLQGDCDDSNADIHPGAFDACGDGIDNDCDGLIDEGCEIWGTWQGMYGGNDNDSVRSIRQTTDGGYVMAGYSASTDIPGATSHGGGDYYTVKLDADGNVEWQRMYGGSDYDYAYSVEQTLDGGYILAGYSKSADIQGVINYGSYGCYLIKLDRFGDVEWQRMYGGSDFDITYAVEQTLDGGYILAGYSNSTDIPGVSNNGLWDYYLVKLDTDGNVEWQRVYGGSARDFAYAVEQTSDGGYIMAGRSDSTDIPGETNNGLWDSYIVKLDTGGNIEWQRMYGGNAHDEVVSIRQTIDGGYIAAGYSESTDIQGVTKNPAGDYYIIRLDQTGNVLWQRMYGGGGNDYAKSIRQTSDGGYILAGQSYSADIPGVMNNGLYDYYVIKLDGFGYVDWQRMYGGSKSDSAYAIEQTAEGGYILAGQSFSIDINGVTNNGESDCYLIKIDPEDIE